MVKNKNGVAVIGALVIDTIQRQNTKRHQIGGTTAYAGLTYHRLGEDVTVVTTRGTLGRPLIDWLQDQGLKVQAAPSSKTAHFVHEPGPSDRILYLTETADPLPWPVLAPVLPQVRLIHLGPLYPDDIATAVLEGLAAFPGKIGLDLQGYMRALEGRRVMTRMHPRVRMALGVADVIKATRSEWEGLCRGLSMHGDEVMTHFGIQQVLVTEGARGGVLLEPGSSVNFEAPAVSTLHDTTGAGDVFFAAYLFGRVQQGKKSEVALADAKHCAGEHIQGRWLDELYQLSSTSIAGDDFESDR